MIIRLKLEPHETPVGDIVGIAIEQIRIENLENVELRYTLEVDASVTQDGTDHWHRRTTYDWSTFVSFLEAVENGQTREFICQLINQELGLTVKEPEPETEDPEDPEIPEEE